MPAASWTRSSAAAVSGLALCCLAAWPAFAEEPAAGTAPSPVEVPAAPRVAVFLQPQGTVLAGALQSTLYVSVGAQVHLGGRASLTLELGIFDHWWPSSPSLEWQQLTFTVVTALGVSVVIRGSADDGLFVTPKVFVIPSHDRTFTMDGPGQHSIDSHSLTLGGGLDVGYQRIWGHFFFALVLGVGVAYLVDAGIYPWPLAGGFYIPLEQHWALSLNTEQVRVGWTF